MAFCMNCGCTVNEHANFCPRCGVSTRKDCSTISDGFSERKVTYDGEIKKCPNCGEVLHSFTPFCSSCGFEIRNAFVSNSVQELARRIQLIESNRSSDKAKNAVIERQLANVIGSFPIPNTKEDILEFMILATSNIGTSDAWIPKVEQAYMKAYATLKGTDTFYQIEKYYHDYQLKIKTQLKNKKKSRSRGVRIATRIILIILGVNFGAIALMFICLIRFLVQNNSEEARLNSIVEKVETALDDHDYQLALRLARTMSYEAHNKDRKEWWELKRESLIDGVIEEAHDNGVELRRPIESPSIPPSTISTTTFSK